MKYTGMLYISRRRPYRDSSKETFLEWLYKIRSTSLIDMEISSIWIFLTHPILLSRYYFEILF